MLQNMIYEFLGTPPSGSEWLQYQYAGITFIIFLIMLIILFIAIMVSAVNIIRR